MSELSYINEQVQKTIEDQELTDSQKVYVILNNYHKLANYHRYKMGELRDVIEQNRKLKKTIKEKTPTK